jgi:DNA-binding winged helix-turn-helix (wHTH) protein
MSSTPLPPALVRFGVFEADLRAGALRRNGVRVRLQDLPFRALNLLLSRPGDVITRQEFRETLWRRDIFVDFEQGISSAVMRLRDALGEPADNPIFIGTIERRGHRWIGPVLSQTVEPEVQTPVLVPVVDQRPDELPSQIEDRTSLEPDNRGFTTRYEIGLTMTGGPLTRNIHRESTCSHW